MADERKGQLTVRKDSGSGDAEDDKEGEGNEEEEDMGEGDGRAELSLRPLAVHSSSGA